MEWKVKERLCAPELWGMDSFAMPARGECRITSEGQLLPMRLAEDAHG